MISLCTLALVSLLTPSSTAAADEIFLASEPALSPDGALLAFSWRGDVWTVPSEGGLARQLTRHAADDSQPAFSPDGEELAFTSTREGGRQVFVVPLEGGEPEQITFHSDGCSLEEWSPDGERLLVSASRDHYWRSAGRFFTVSRGERAAHELLFDAYGSDGRLSPDGSRLLFAREGSRWWRKGYHGPSAGQIWVCQLAEDRFTKLLALETECLWPLWNPDGESFYYVGAESGSLNLREYDWATGETRALTRFEDDSVVFPCISRDGSTIVFRHLFDLYRFRPGEDDVPQKIEIIDGGDTVDTGLERRVLSSASEFASSDDGLEIAFVAGGDLWVMDTELREPVRITDTPEEESEPQFSPDGDFIYYISDAGGQSDVWRASRKDAEAYWWLQSGFELQQLTKDADVESELTWSPAGDKLAFVKDTGGLWTIDPDGTGAAQVLSSWDPPDYEWSPDGKWFAYVVNDDDYNTDVWIIPSDGSGAAVNVSRHPDEEASPAWSPDGKILAFTGRRVDTEVDVYYVWLSLEDHELTKRDRKLEKALEAMKKVREKDKKKGKKKDEPKKEEEKKEETPAGEPEEAAGSEEKPAAEEEKKKEEKPEEEEEESDLPEVKIDFDLIHERLRRISIPDSAESGLFWHHEDAKLAFTATVDGKRGTYTVEIPDEMEPKLLTDKTGDQARWIEQGNKVLWLSGGTPASVSDSGKVKKYDFTARQAVDRAERFRAGFDLAWRTMRDGFYDERLNNRNWDAIRRKYRDAAAASPDATIFGTVVNLMLGELNASHMGFYPTGSRGPRGSSSGDNKVWRESTAHLGLRFDPDHNGPGLRVRDVIPESPADMVKSKILAGEIVLAIDEVAIDPGLDLTDVLNGTLDRELTLKVRDAAGEEREVRLRPISFRAARRLLYDAWIDDNRKKVEEASEGRLGYMHIRSMDMPSFHRFENEVYAVGSGREGIVIDVRDNGGGFTADHLLTVLCQPRHAITVGRGGGPGYPQDRMVYAAWHKPLIVLCNQNSFSNAEIFSHAIKTLDRGQLVGVQTAGGVISTGGRSIMDLGFLRKPLRGWFVLGTGEDMELNGAVPDHVVWPEPGAMPRGDDAQLDKAIEVLLEDVEEWKARSRPQLRKASER